MNEGFKKTDELLKELENTESFERYVEANRTQFVKETVGDRLDRLIAERHVKKTSVFSKAEISSVYGYQILADTRRPARDRIIQLLIGLDLDVNEIQQFLKSTEYAPLYAKNARDAALLFCLMNRYSVIQINDFLMKKGFPILGEN